MNSLHYSAPDFKHNMGHFSHLTMLIAAGVIFHGILWARNAAFLWSRRRVILHMIGVAELWS